MFVLKIENVCVQRAKSVVNKREKERERLCVVLFIYAASAAVFVLHSLRGDLAPLFALFCSSLILY